MDVLAVVINVGTDTAATLALASLATHAPTIPVRLLNCEPTDDSRRWFEALRRELGFEVVESPIRSHGVTLDNVFRAATSDVVLLLDSDAEVVDGGVVNRCLAHLRDDRVFGAGFADGPAWMDAKEGATTTEHVAYFQERPWMPFAMFRTSMVRTAQAAGRSFQGRKVWNDFPPNSRLSALLAARFQDNFVPRSAKIARLP